MVTMEIQERTCKNCKLKYNGCDVWKDKNETTASGWDKNRFAIGCYDYEREEVKHD